MKKVLPLVPLLVAVVVVIVVPAVVVTAGIVTAGAAVTIDGNSISACAGATLPAPAVLNIALTRLRKAANKAVVALEKMLLVVVVDIFGFV